MRSRRNLLYGAGIAAGAIFATLIFLLGGRGNVIDSNGENERPPSTAAIDQDVAKRKVSVSADSIIQEPPADDIRLAQGGTTEVKPRQLTFAESLRKSSEAYEQEVRDEKVAEDRRLVAAGFSPERLDELQHRKDVLLAQLEQKEYERTRQGIEPSVLSFAAAFDGDLLLQDEMTDSEYMNYRRAKSLPIEVRVIKVLSGSNAELAGLQPGDQITKYNGARVFDNRVLKLRAIAAESLSGSGLIEIVRNGLPMTITLPRGPIGIEGTEVSYTSALYNRLSTRGR